MDSSTDYSQNQDNPATLRDYLSVLFRQKTVIVTMVIAMMGTVFLGLMLKTTVYEAQVKMLISAQKLVQAPNYRDLMDAPNVEESLTQSEIVTSTPVLKRVVLALGLDWNPVDYEMKYATPLKVKIYDIMKKFKKDKLSEYSPAQQRSIILDKAIDDLRKRVKVKPIPDTNMFTISVEDFTPTHAAVTANVVARSYVIFDLEQQLADLSLKYGNKEPNVVELQDNIDEMVRNLNGSILSNVDAIGPATVKIIEQAQPPLEPKGQSKLTILILAFIISIFLGVMFAFVFEYMDTTFKSPQQIETELNLPFLGSVPRCGIGEKLLINTFKMKTRYAHFYQVLSDQLYLIMKDKDLKSILVTSAGFQEDTSVIIANLGFYLSANAHHSVLLLDANFRHPSLHTLVKVGNTSGLADVIEGKITLKEAVREINKNLHVVTAGQTELNPVILLNSQKVKDILEEAKKKFEVVLIDCPNIVGFKESIALAEKTDATVVVVSEGITRRHIVKLALQPLWAKKVNLLGVVLNNRTFPIPKFVYERI